MHTLDYFKHARQIGAFTASDCLAMARQAAALDRAAALRKLPAPTVVWYEVLPDGRGMLRFRDGITVY